MRNIRLLAVLALAFILAPSAMSQFRYAPIAGVTYNDLKFRQDIVKIGKLVGMQAGVQGELMFPGIGFGIDIGLLYNLTGASVDLGSRKIWAADGFRKTNVELHNIQIPLHLRFKWTRMSGIEDYIAPFVYGGPDFSFTVAHSSAKGNPGTGDPFKFSGGDFSLTAGGGFELWKRWQLSVQYTWGMSYLVKTVKLDNYSARNRQWAVRLAYFF